MKPTTSCANVVKEIRYQVFNRNFITRWGTENEHIAIAQFESEDPGTFVRRCDLVVDEEFPYLAASPDGLVGDESIIEVKCLSSAKTMLPMDVIGKGRINLMEIKNDKLLLKASHNYMYQTAQGMISVKIQDKEFWENKILGKLVTFFNHCVLSEIINPRHSQKMPIREPEHIKEAQICHSNTKKLDIS
ncbi:hypothetical protein PR048_003961 [Dryococelus australis]|uniref:YqaJ viral recombinase domain-containing protein n=1 Tax=Dryococelus australis TaxID=614101 RepID=A0ABQ9I439_9NEOP|nr:hypothetical protein PR048_003961 [Dryococelus australis]